MMGMKQKEKKQVSFYLSKRLVMHRLFAEKALKTPLIIKVEGLEILRNSWFFYVKFHMMLICRTVHSTVCAETITVIREFVSWIWSKKCMLGLVQTLLNLSKKACNVLPFWHCHSSAVPRLVFDKWIWCYCPWDLLQHPGLSYGSQLSHLGNVQPMFFSFLLYWESKYLS